MNRQFMDDLAFLVWLFVRLAVVGAVIGYAMTGYITLNQ